MIGETSEVRDAYSDIVRRVRLGEWKSLEELSDFLRSDLTTYASRLAYFAEDAWKAGAYVYERETGFGPCRYELRRVGDVWRCDYTNPPDTYRSGSEYGPTPAIAVGPFCPEARDALLAACDGP
jgi:hypothetical protein